MSEVKVTIEWDSSTAGIYQDPMKVHIAGEAVAKAMGMVGKPEKDTEFIRLMPTGNGNVEVMLADGARELFPSYRQALEFLEAYFADRRYQRK